jgi:hypothetical protein
MINEARNALLKELEAEKQHLVRRLRQVETDIEVTKKIGSDNSIAVLQSNAAIRKDQFKGKRIAVAIKEVLAIKNGRATLSEVMEALKAGGCDLKGRPERNLKFALAQGHGLKYDGKDTVQLAS